MGSFIVPSPRDKLSIWEPYSVLRLVAVVMSTVNSRGIRRFLHMEKRLPRSTSVGTGSAVFRHSGAIFVPTSGISQWMWARPFCLMAALLFENHAKFYLKTLNDPQPCATIITPGALRVSQLWHDWLVQREAAKQEMHQGTTLLPCTARTPTPGLLASPHRHLRRQKPVLSR